MTKTQGYQKAKLEAEIRAANVNLRPGAESTIRIDLLGQWWITTAYKGATTEIKFPNWDKAIRHFEIESQCPAIQMELF